MITRAVARIQWRSSEEGGREAPPSVRRYSTVVRFDDDVESEGAWSLVVESDTQLDIADSIVATVLFLAPEKAPSHLLTPGHRFQLLEGRRVVATGEILDTVQEHESASKLEMNP